VNTANKANMDDKDDTTTGVLLHFN